MSRVVFPVAFAMALLLGCGDNHDLEEVPPTPVALPVVALGDELLAGHLAKVAMDWAPEHQTTRNLLDPSKEGEVFDASTTQTLAVQDNEILSSQPILSSDGEVLGMTEPPFDAEPETEQLWQSYCQVAYLGVSGQVGAIKVGLFRDNLSGSTETVSEGRRYQGLEVLELNEEYALVTVGDAGPVRKPRVAWMLPPGVPDDELSEEEKLARAVRYQELFGNPSRAAYRQSIKRNEIFGIPLPDGYEAMRKSQVYQEEYGEFYRNARNRRSGEKNNHEPFEDTLDEDVTRYFDQYWPDVEVQPVD